MQDIIFQELNSYLKEALRYIAAASFSGVIGNRVDAWFMSLFYHQRRRLIDWLNRWNPELDDLRQLSENEELRLLFSNVVSKITEELDNKKMILWPLITNSIIRHTEIKLDKKQLFISIFNRIDTPALQYLAALSTYNGLPVDQIFPDANKFPMPESVNPIYNFGQLQCATIGLTRLSNESPTMFYLTPLGEEF